MIKSMTGFSKTEIKENGIIVIVELKSLNGKFLELNCRLPRQLQHKELEIRDLVREVVSRGTISINIGVELEESSKPFAINLETAEKCYLALNELKKKLKTKETVTIAHVLTYSNQFNQLENEFDENAQFNLVKKAVREAIKSLDNMRKREGQQISKDIFMRIKKITDTVNKIEKMGIERIPAEREKLRLRVAQLFESDEYDEQRLQTEMVLLADKLDISEECVRLYSHFKFFHETVKGNEPPGRKINFLMQEMNREINTIGSKANDATVSQMVVIVKEEIERIREQIQNIE
jgi:uncharacterized protein (TIGR00255 family)